MQMVGLGVLGTALGCAGPQRLEPARAACPPPRLATALWVTYADSAGVSFRLPAAYQERAPRDGVREWDLDGDNQQYVLAGYISSSNPPASLGRFVSPGMLEMSQCIDSTGGREVLVQSWRTPGGTFRRGRRLDRYDVFAVVPVRPDLRFYVASGGYERRAQDIALAAIRTVVVATSPGGSP
jgi:hypothetical protein